MTAPMYQDTETYNGIVEVDIADTNYVIYREALSAVLIDKMCEPVANTKRRQVRRRGQTMRPKADVKKVSKTEDRRGQEPDLDGWTVVNLGKRQEPGPQGLKDKGRTTVQDTDIFPDDPADDLAEFVDYLARETFDLLPAELQTLEHHLWAGNAALREKYGVNEERGTSGGVPMSAALNATRVTELLPGLEPSPVADSMQAYGLTSANEIRTANGGHQGGRTTAEVVAPALSSYLASVTAAPPSPRSTRDQAEGCEICGRDWIPLSYHHLIPRFVHAKVVKRGWHRTDELQNVAWLCGACHRQVHRFANHEDLARYYYTVERLLAEPEMQRYAAWASRLRWKGK